MSGNQGREAPVDQEQEETSQGKPGSQMPSKSSEDSKSSRASNRPPRPYDKFRIRKPGRSRNMNAPRKIASQASPPGYPASRIGARRAVRNPELAEKIRQLALPLQALVQVTTGAAHPDFPRTLLAYWLLTDEQLDDLAAFYHQKVRCDWTLEYPCPVPWPPGMTIDQKRRRIGRFIGLRGCETPIAERGRLREQFGESAELLRLRTEAEITEEARQARLRAQREEEERQLLRAKMGW